jgi:hypothetical protein
MVIVDYLQKVYVPHGPPVEDDRITVVVEGLKDLALDLDVPVLAVAAGDKQGISSGRRMRTSHLRGSSAVAYEADCVLMLNNKFDVVARHHLVYDLGSADGSSPGRCSASRRTAAAWTRWTWSSGPASTSPASNRSAAWSPSSWSTSACSSTDHRPSTGARNGSRAGHRALTGPGAW